jgi:hypothetical protein
MRNIVVTTPKSEIENSAKEAKKCIEDGGGYYFRSLPTAPKGIEIGSSRIYFVEDGFIRGFGIIIGVTDQDSNVCDVTKREWKGRCFVWMPASSWKWIKPLPCKGFQGWRYFDDDVEVVGGWLDPKPIN